CRRGSKVGLPSHLPLSTKLTYWRSRTADDQSPRTSLFLSEDLLFFLPRLTGSGCRARLRSNAEHRCYQMERIKMKRTHDEQDECPVAQGSRGITATPSRSRCIPLPRPAVYLRRIFQSGTTGGSIGERGAKMKKGR